MFFKNITRILLIIVIVSQSTTLFSQMMGSETIVNTQVYKGVFVVNGDMNTYYPVVFKGTSSSQNVISHLKLFRSYSEAGPDELSPTHKGGLTLEIDVNYGGWGGSTYGWRVMDLRQTYHTTFAGASHAMHRMGFLVWLRGGGFVYHYEVDKPSNLQVCYSTSELIYDNALPHYDVYAPSPKTEQDVVSINAHKNDHWDYLKGKPFDTRGHLGILTPTSDYPLDVNGTIRAKEIKVESSNWADFVFEDDYQLRNIEELEQFISQNGHLPDIPNEKEVEENGISLGEMNAKLLQKIEELTLYTIQLNKENQELKKSQEESNDRIQKQEKQMRNQEQKLNSFKALEERMKTLENKFKNQTP